MHNYKTYLPSSVIVGTSTATPMSLLNTSGFVKTNSRKQTQVVLKAKDEMPVYLQLYKTG